MTMDYEIREGPAPTTLLQKGGTYIHGAGGNAPARGRDSVVIFRQAVYDDVDALTHKKVTAGLPDRGPRVRREASSDSRDPYDRGILDRSLLFWEARLRRRIRAHLAEWHNLRDSDDYAPVVPERADDRIIYPFVMEIEDNVHVSLTEHIHRFLVRGIMYDWYTSMGIETDITKEELESLLDDIAGMLAPRWVPTPLQPFDPKGPHRHF